MYILEVHTQTGSKYSHSTRRLVYSVQPIWQAPKRQALFGEDQCLTLCFGQPWRAGEAGRRCFFCTSNFKGTDLVCQSSTSRETCGVMYISTSYI